MKSTLSLACILEATEDLLSHVANRLMGSSGFGQQEKGKNNKIDFLSFPVSLSLSLFQTTSKGMWKGFSRPRLKMRLLPTRGITGASFQRTNKFMVGPIIISSFLILKFLILFVSANARKLSGKVIKNIIQKIVIIVNIYNFIPQAFCAISGKQRRKGTTTQIIEIRILIINSLSHNNNNS